MTFNRFAQFCLLSIFLIIVAGAFVRMTGSGMGCPDWPKCFGLIVPPTSIEQLQWMSNKDFEIGQMILKDEQLWSAKSNFKSEEVFFEGNWELYTKHDYAKFNPAHTWIEFINRLIGAISGLLTFVMLLWSFRYWNQKRKLVYLSALVVFLMGFQGWLGATVVYSVLQPFQITIHMMMALLIVAIMVYLISEIPLNTFVQRVYDRSFKRILLLALFLSTIQIALGTQVRQLIDEIASSLDYNRRDLWLGMVGGTFKIHRSFAILVLIAHAKLLHQNYTKGLGFEKIYWLFGIVMVEVLSGIVLSYFDMLALMQPIHLVFASLLFVVQFAVFFELRKARG